MAEKRTSTNLNKLKEAEDSTKTAIVNFIADTAIPEDEGTLRSTIAQIKQSKSKYEAASRALSEWYTNNGSPAQAAEVRKDRMQIIFKDSAELVKGLNTQLTQLGVEVESSLGQPSVIYGRKSSSIANLNDLVDNNELGATKEPSVHNKASNNHSNGPQNNSQHSSHSNDNNSHGNQSQNNSQHSSHSNDNNSHGNQSQNNGQHSVHEDVGGQSNGYENQSNHDNPWGEPSSEEKVKKFLDNTEKKFQEVNINSGLPHVDKLDPVSRRHLKQDLLRGLGDPYDGDPEKFWEWKTQFSSLLLEAEVGPLDTLYILKANCTGEPKAVISNKIATASSNPQLALANAWKALHKRFGDNAVVAQALLRRLDKFPVIRSCSQVKELKDLMDFCCVLQANMAECFELKILDMQDGMARVWSKTPEQLQTRWRKCFIKHRNRTGSTPNFDQFVSFFEEFMDEVDVPGFEIYKHNSTVGNAQTTNRQRKTLHTEVATNKCLYHETSGHLIVECNVFKNLAYQERKDFATKRNLCYGCLGGHRIADCSRTQVCSICQKNHVTVMHRESSYQQENKNQPRVKQSSVSENNTSEQKAPINVKTTCTNVCVNHKNGGICSKTLIIDVRHGANQKTLRCLCIIDEHNLL